MRIGIDIGGTKTHAVLVGDNGAVIAESRRATGFGADEVIATAAAVVAELAEAEPAGVAAARSVGVGIPGAVDDLGRVRHAVNLGLEGLDLGARLGAALGRPVRVANDVNAAALGVYSLLEHGPSHSMAYLNLGTGLAAGLVLDGRLWRGSRGVAGEIGHIPVDPDGPECPCGQRGCLELSASGSAVARLWPSDDPKPVRALFAAAEAGDERALAVRERLVSNVAAAVRILVLTVDVDRVVIGGGLSSLGDELLAAVRGVLEAWSEASPFLRMQDLPTRVDLLPRGFPAAAVGAALIGVEPLGAAGAAHPA
ncbi:ROK family protein [Schumannella luteola]|uniref:Putative NBD/HSP70 family sugar kinase n=1 Tax=Schumannella luteola TaxID=472059 RepID=A0A852YGX1_9MICO|nr:putative NBD/HSP70 family sugar kinase [Schumannella luteola]TPX03121.1 ROK family protein [Schumannella luteola]